MSDRFKPPSYLSRYRDSGEGGMWVMLVAFDKVDPCGYEPAIQLHSDEVFIGADRPFPQAKVPYDEPNVWGTRFNEGLTYRAALHLGSTGWSGWDTVGGAYWRCTYNDLTDEGKALYATISSMFADSVVYLLTFLDT